MLHDFSKFFFVVHDDARGLDQFLGKVVNPALNAPQALVAFLVFANATVNRLTDMTLIVDV